MSSLRIAARHAATELSHEEIEKVSGGLMANDTVRHTGNSCELDASTDCWVVGGDGVARVVNSDD